MNREIKFRGKHSNKWIYGYLLKNIDDNKCYISVSLDQFYQVKEETIGQYTGLKDKNGVEIYENMILDNKYIVLFENCKYILKDISNGDIIDLWRYMNENRGEITKEYSKI